MELQFICTALELNDRRNEKRGQIQLFSIEQ